MNDLSTTDYAVIAVFFLPAVFAAVAALLRRYQHRHSLRSVRSLGTIRMEGHR